MSKWRFIILGLLVLLVDPWLSSAAIAQTAGTTVHIHAVEPPQTVTPETGGLPGLSVRATFSLLDPTGTVLKSDIENATLRLDGVVYSGKFSKLETDWSVVVLLDTSGTLGSSRAFEDFRSVRDSLSRSLASAPGTISFALIPFNDRAPTVQVFTRERDRFTNALKAVRAEANKPACLNDGLYEAISRLSSAPGRRAVFVVTASADTCATRSSQMVVDFALQHEVQLYAIGVQGYTITQQELEAFTQPTGGLEDMRGVAELSFALDNLMAVLGSQWQAVWVLYPAEGPQTAEISVKLPDASVITGDLSFVSDRGYARPPTVAIAGMAQSTLGGVRFNLDIINPERIDALDINLISKLTGRSVYQERLTELTDSILLPPSELVKDADYSLVVTALDEQGQVLSQSEPLEFRYQPLEASLTVAVTEWPTVEEPYFVVSVTAQNLEGVTEYRLWLEHEQSGTPVKGTEATYTAGEALRVPVSELKSGGYVVRVQALGTDDYVLVEAAPLKVTHEEPSGLARLIASLRGSPAATVGMCGLGVLAAVALGALAWFLVPRGKGAKSVELALPEKARRAQPPAEPRSSPVDRSVPARAPPVQVEPPPARAEPARAQPPQPSPVPVREQPPQPPPVPARVQPPKPSPAPPQRPVGETVVDEKPPEVVAIVTIAEPAIAPFEAQIRKWPFRIGRAADNDGVIPVESTSGVSGHQCFITFSNGHWYVQDDKSKFGTTVNGQIIPKGQPFELEDGVILGLGPLVRIRFRVVSGLRPATRR